MKNSDIQLIHRILDDDENAFAELVEKYQKQVHALVWRKIGDFHIAEEITQDTFLKAYQKLGTLKKPQRLASWLYVIATNRCSSWLRKKHLRAQLLEDKDVAHPEKTTYSEYVHEENERITAETQRDVVKKLLAKLDESERTVMTLHYFGEMSCTEIGEFLGISANTVKSRLRRAQQRLQKEETMIREALDNFKITPNLTENIMREISRTKLAAPSSSKPIVPWAIAASTLVVVLIMLGFGNQQFLARFQQPYSLDANAKMTVEIIDAPIVANLESKPNVRTQVGSVKAQDKINTPDLQPNNTPAAIAEAQAEETMKDYTQWALPEKAKARLGKGGIRSMQFSPDGRQLAVGSDIGVWLYDAKTGKEVSMFPGTCQSLAFSPDGRFLANGGGRFSGKELQLWEVATGRKMSLPDALLPASALRFSEDGKTLFSLGDWGDSIGQLDIETKKGDVKKIEGRSWETIKRRSLPEPYTLTHDKFGVGGRYGSIELWSTTTGKKLSTLRGHTKPSEVEKHILALAFSPDGKHLASGSRDTTVLLWDTTSNDKPITLKKHTGWISVLAFSPGAKMLASGSTDKTVQLWDTATGEPITTFTGHIKSISALTFSPDGTTLASGSADGTVRFWNIETGAALPARISGHTEWVKAVAFFKDNTTLASAAVNGIISFWDLKTLQKTDVQMKRHQDLLAGLAFSSDGTQLVSMGAEGNVIFNDGVAGFSGTTRPDGLIRITDVQTGRELANLITGGDRGAIAFSPDGKTVAFSSFGNICVWNTETGFVLNNPLSSKVKLDQDGALVFPPGENHEDLRHQTRMISALVFSPDGEKLVSGTDRGQVEVWDVETGAVLTSLTEQNLREQITALSFSSYGTLLAVGSNKRVRIMGNNKLARLKEVPQGVEALVFVPDRNVLVTGLRNGVIELWDVESGDKLITLDGHSEPVGTLVFSPDHKTLVSTGQDGTILVWDWEEVLEGIKVGE